MTIATIEDYFLAQENAQSGFIFLTSIQEYKKVLLPGYLIRTVIFHRMFK